MNYLGVLEKSDPGPTVDELLRTMEMVKADKGLSPQERKNLTRRLARKLEKIQDHGEPSPVKKVGATPSQTPEEQLSGVVERLRAVLPEVGQETLTTQAGAGYFQDNVLEALVVLKVDPAGVVGTMVEAYRKRWSEPPQWFTVLETETGKVLVLGPVPMNTGF